MVGDRLAHLVGAVDRPVSLVLGLYHDRAQALGRPFHLADLGLPLAQVAPVRVAVPETTLVSLGHDPYHPHVGDFAERAPTTHAIAWRYGQMSLTFPSIRTPIGISEQPLILPAMRQAPWARETDATAPCQSP